MRIWMVVLLLLMIVATMIQGQMPDLGLLSNALQQVNGQVAKPMDMPVKPPCPNCIEENVKNEMPLIDPNHYEPSMMIVCDDMLTEDDIYTGTNSILIEVSNALRRGGCPQQHFLVHPTPMHTHSLFGDVRIHRSDKVKNHPITGVFVSTMDARARELIQKAGQCQLDLRLLFKIIRLAMKELSNKSGCCQTKLQIMQNRDRWRSPWTTAPPLSAFGPPKQADPNVNPAGIGGLPNQYGVVPGNAKPGEPWGIPGSAITPAISPYMPRKNDPNPLAFKSGPFSSYGRGDLPSSLLPYIPLGKFGGKSMPPGVPIPSKNGGIAGISGKNVPDHPGGTLGMGANGGVSLLPQGISGAPSSCRECDYEKNHPGAELGR